MKRALPWLILLGVGALLWTVPAWSAKNTDPTAVYTVPDAGIPYYLLNRTDRTFWSKVKRVSGNTLNSASPAEGHWEAYARHRYSKDQPWNADGSLLLIENRADPDTTAWLFLDGDSYLPKAGYSVKGNGDEFRWHPDSANILIGVVKDDDVAYWWDVDAGNMTRSWALPFAPYGIGNGEGEVSADGRYMALYNADSMFVLDMSKTGTAAWGPRYGFPSACSLSVAADTTGCKGVTAIDNVSISPSGKYVDIQYAGFDADTYDEHRIYDVNQTTLALTYHLMTSGSTRCGGHNNVGWLFPLSHSDMGYDGATEVIVGMCHCTDIGTGDVYRLNLNGGGGKVKLTNYTGSPSTAAYAHHISMQATDRPGWAYVSFFKDAEEDVPFSDEIAAIKVDGSAVERITHTHTNFDGCYNCEAHPVPNRDGTRVLFNSAWNQDCSCCFPADTFKDFVVTDW